jgi:hypothetical protein
MLRGSLSCACRRNIAPERVVAVAATMPPDCEQAAHEGVSCRRKMAPQAANRPLARTGKPLARERLSPQDGPLAANRPLARKGKTGRSEDAPCTH